MGAEEYRQEEQEKVNVGNCNVMIFKVIFKTIRGSKICFLVVLCGDLYYVFPTTTRRLQCLCFCSFHGIYILTYYPSKKEKLANKHSELDYYSFCLAPIATRDLTYASPASSEDFL